MPPTDPILPTTPPPELDRPPEAIASGTDAALSNAIAPEAQTTTVYRPSPLKRQHRDPRGSQPDYTPVQLIFLNGLYQGKSLDLGLAVNEAIHSQSAEWEDQEGEGIRVGVNFKKLGNREFSFNLEYADITHDIIHLAEATAHAQEIGDGAKQPPFMMLVQGDARIDPIVCTSLQKTYSDPLPNNGGFRHAKIEMRFKLVGGRGSRHAMGAVLTSTPLGDEVAAQTQLERQRQGQQAIAKLLLAPCLGESGSDALIELIEQGQLSNPAAVAALDPSTLIQAAIAGLIPAEALQSEELEMKLRVDLALIMAANEPGVATGIHVQAFAEALLTGDISKLPTAPTNLQAQALSSKLIFDEALEAIASQDLGEEAAIFEPGNLAGERLRSSFGSCGLSLRQSGAAAIGAAPPDSEAIVLESINNYLADSNVNSNQIRERFGLRSEAQVRALRNGHPYQSKLEFLQHLSQGGNGAIAYSVWSEAQMQAEPEAPDDEAPGD